MAKKLKSDNFSIVNINGKQELFRTDDTSINKFTFSIINNTGEALSLTGDTEGKPSSFIFNFETMLTEDVAKNLDLTLPENWVATFIAGDQTTPPSWSVNPIADTVLQQAAAIDILISNISCTETAPGNFLISYANIPGYDDPFIPVPKHLTVINLPDPKKETLPLKDTYTRVVHPVQGQSALDETEVNGKMSEAVEVLPIYITYDQGALIENGFTFLLTNTSKFPLVPPVPESGDQNNPVVPTLYISFLFGDDDPDITTQMLADNNMSIDVSASLPWTPVKHAGGSPYWQFFPIGQEIMKGLETVSFPVSKIITALNVKPDAISIMYVQFNDIPGYNDGAYTLIMQKLVANAEMKMLEAERYFMYIGENVTISWESILAKRVTIEYYLEDGTPIFLDSDTGVIKLNGKNLLLPEAPTAKNTIITAIAYDNKGKNTQQIHIQVSYDIPAAQILFFTAGEMLAVTEFQSQGTNYVGLRWEVKYAKKTVISYTWGDPIEVPLTQTSIVIPISSLEQWSYFTLSAYSILDKYPEPTQEKRFVYLGGGGSGETEL